MSYIIVHEIVLLSAFRYMLGRKTYAVSMIVDEIIKQWPNLSSSSKTKIIQEIKIAISSDKAGMEMDIRQWQTILLLEGR